MKRVEIRVASLEYTVALITGDETDLRSETGDFLNHMRFLHYLAIPSRFLSY